MKCAACDHPGEGYAHVCAGSGTYVAAEAYDADAVNELMETWPYFTVAVNFKMRAADEAMVRDKLTPLVGVLLNDDLVQSGANFSVTPADEQVAA